MCTTRRGVRESIPASRAVYYYSHITIIIIAVFVRSAAPFVLAADDKRRRRGRGRKPSLPARGWIYRPQRGRRAREGRRYNARCIIYVTFRLPETFPVQAFYQSLFWRAGRHRSVRSRRRLDTHVPFVWIHPVTQIRLGHHREDRWSSEHQDLYAIDPTVSARTHLKKKTKQNNSLVWSQPAAILYLTCHVGSRWIKDRGEPFIPT